MVRSLVCACALAVSAVAMPVSDKPNFAQAVWLDDYPDAKCLDGSPGIYYIRTATSAANATKWVFHIQGGGWCTSDGNGNSDCFERAKTNLGSSIPAKSGDSAVGDLGVISGCENNRWCGALMVNDEVINPYAHDWNAVLIRYCDGASFIGDAVEPVMRDGVPVYYRGWHIMQAVMDDLLDGDLAQATEVLFGGDSAGGLAAYLHLDYVASRVPQARVLGMPDSGFWPDSEGYASKFRSMLAEQNGTAGLMPICVAANPDDVSRCIFPENFASLIETPMFPMQSLVDPLQKKNSPEGSPQAHSDWLLEQMQQKVVAKEQNGGWIHSCSRHCGASLLTIDGMHYPQAVEAFLHGSDPQRLFLQNEAYPCDSCCNDGAIMMDTPKAVSQQASSKVASVAV